MPRLPRRTVKDWHPDTGLTEAEWLAHLGEQGWTPEHGAGVDVDVAGTTIRRWALIDDLDIHPAGPWPEPGVPGTDRPHRRT